MVTQKKHMYNWKKCLAFLHFGIAYFSVQKIFANTYYQRRSIYQNYVRPCSLQNVIDVDSVYYYVFFFY